MAVEQPEGFVEEEWTYVGQITSRLVVCVVHMSICGCSNKIINLSNCNSLKWSIKRFQVNLHADFYKDTTWIFLKRSLRDKFITPYTTHRATHACRRNGENNTNVIPIFITHHATHHHAHTWILTYMNILHSYAFLPELKRIIHLLTVFSSEKNQNSHIFCCVDCKK